MPKPVSPQLMQKLRDLKRLKAEGAFQPRQQAMRALDARIAALRAEVARSHAAPGQAIDDPAQLQAAARHTDFVAQKIDSLMERKRRAQAEFEAAKTELKRAIASQSQSDEAKSH